MASLKKGFQSNSNFRITRLNLSQHLEKHCYKSEPSRPWYSWPRPKKILRNCWLRQKIFPTHAVTWMTARQEIFWRTVCKIWTRREIDWRNNPFFNLDEHTLYTHANTVFINQWTVSVIAFGTTAISHWNREEAFEHQIQMLSLRQIDFMLNAVNRFWI